MSPAGDDYVAFVRARQGPLLRSAFMICGDHHLAQDLLQDALVKLASRWERLRDEAPEAYVRRILYRDSVSSWRRTRREVVADHDPDGVVTPLHARADERVQDWVSGAHVREALLLLPPRQRAVIVLRYYEDLSEVDIADALGISRGTVKSQASDAMRTLRKLLPDVGDVETQGMPPADQPSSRRPFSRLRAVGEDGR